MTEGITRITIFVAEDDALLRHFLLMTLGDEADFEVVGSTGSGREALESVLRLRPRVLLLDLGLPEMTGIEVLESLAGVEGGPAILVLSGDDSGETQLAAARLGARGFLGKARSSAVFRDTIRAVAAGEVRLPPEIVGRILSEYPALARAARDQERPIHQLSQKEREVLIQVARGLTNQQIGTALCMSVSTVKAHMRSVFKKLELPGRTEAAVFAVREGLV